MTSDNDKKEKKDNDKPKIPEEQMVVTEHSVTIDGKLLEYTATTGTIILRDEVKKEEDKAKATIFYVSYTKKDGDLNRPITYSFNGGPGSSSVWMHLGLLGPKRVVSEDNAKAVKPPYQLIENNYSILDHTDLVFIDPVSTGYSRHVPGEDAKDFHGFKKDYESVGDFIRLWTTRNNRWGAPKFLIGESYGTTRASALSGYLQESYGMYLNGIMLISSILNFQTARFVAGNDLPFITFLPTYCATAHYHKKLDEELSKDLVKTLDEVREFTGNEYTLALMKGDRLDGEERENIITKLVKYTGLSREFIIQTNFRINIFQFTKELLRDQRKTVGRLDSRFTGIDRDATGGQFSYDPSYSVILGPYSSTLQDYIRRELKFESDMKYHILSNLYENWSYSDHQNQYVNVADTLRDSMTKNPFLKVFVANGYYDFATPFFATEYTFDHLSLDPSLRDNISMAYYEAGHMMYLHEASLAKQKKDLVNFINSAL